MLHSYQTSDLPIMEKLLFSLIKMLHSYQTQDVGITFNVGFSLIKMLHSYQTSINYYFYILFIKN